MEKNYLYADEKEQMTRANGLYVLTSILFYIFAAVIVFVAYLRGIRSLGFTCMIGVVVLVMIVLKFDVIPHKQRRPPDTLCLEYRAFGDNVFYGHSI